MSETLRAQAEALAAGTATARGLAEMALEKIAAQTASGVPAFISVNPERVRAEADASDQRRTAGRALSEHDGVPYGVKDLFDVEGEVTTAGSVVLRGNAAAPRDSDVVARLRAKGFVALGRTNMTEFAYSGLGLNPHYGTPASVNAGSDPRIPGGSSSGTAVAVASGVCSFGLGTDTGGSCRIPAAFNGISGFKPSARRVSKRGVYALSATLDSVGPIASSAACCATLDGIMSGGTAEIAQLGPSIRLAVLGNYVVDGLDPKVAEDFARALRRLSDAGVELVDTSFDALNELPSCLKNGGIVAYEASRAQSELIAARRDAFDPHVVSRMEMGFNTRDADYADVLAARARMITAFATFMRGFDAVICPTVPVVAPLMSAISDDVSYRQLNGEVLRNTYVFNFLDGCSGSIPMHARGSLPTGLMLSAGHGQDQRILQLMQKCADLIQEFPQGL